jgi:hypothetical protein
MFCAPASLAAFSSCSSSTRTDCLRLQSKTGVFRWLLHPVPNGTWDSWGAPRTIGPALASPKEASACQAGICATVLLSGLGQTILPKKRSIREQRDEVLDLTGFALGGGVKVILSVVESWTPLLKHFTLSLVDGEASELMTQYTRLHESSADGTGLLADLCTNSLVHEDVICRAMAHAPWAAGLEPTQFVAALVLGGLRAHVSARDARVAADLEDNLPGHRRTGWTKLQPSDDRLASMRAHESGACDVGDATLAFAVVECARARLEAARLRPGLPSAAAATPR